MQRKKMRIDNKVQQKAQTQQAQRAWNKKKKKQEDKK
jgi:hypothetical protein